MNIDKLKELIELSKLLDDTNSVVNTNDNSGNIGRYVIVRGYDAGVWAGEVVKDKKGEIVLKDARMLWRWWTKKGIGLSSLAVNGLDETKSEIKILDTQKEVLINDNRVSTFYYPTKKVEKQIREYPVAIHS